MAFIYADCAFWDMGCWLGDRDPQHFGWATDDDEQGLHDDVNGCGALTGWIGNDAVPRGGGKVWLNLPFFIKEGRVERAIVSAGGPKITCDALGFGKASPLTMSDVVPHAYNGITESPEHDAYVPMIWSDPPASASIATAAPSISATVSVVTVVLPWVTSPVRIDRIGGSATEGEPATLVIRYLEKRPVHHQQFLDRIVDDSTDSCPGHISTTICLGLLAKLYPVLRVLSLSLIFAEMSQPQVKAPREFKFVGGPSRKRRCRTGPGAAPRSARPAPGRPKSRLPSPQRTITVASEAPAAGSLADSAAAAATRRVDAVSTNRTDGDHHPASHQRLHSNSPSHEESSSGRLPNFSGTPETIAVSTSAAPGHSAAVAASAQAGPTPNLARIDSTLPALQNANHYDDMEAGGFLDWSSADQIAVSNMDDIGIPAPTNNFFTPFDSIFQMPFFSTPDQPLQDPVEPPGRNGFGDNTVPTVQGDKDTIDSAVDDIDLADAVELGHGENQDSPVFGHGLSGNGSSDSTESIDRNDDSYVPIAPVIGNISEKFSRLFEQYDQEFCVWPLTHDFEANPFRYDAETGRGSPLLWHCILALSYKHIYQKTGQSLAEAKAHKTKATQLLEELENDPHSPTAQGNLLDALLILMTLDCATSARGPWVSHLNRAHKILEAINLLKIPRTPRMQAQIDMLVWWDVTLALTTRQGLVLSGPNVAATFNKPVSSTFYNVSGCPDDLFKYMFRLGLYAREFELAAHMTCVKFDMGPVLAVEAAIKNWRAPQFDDPDAEFGQAGSCSSILPDAETMEPTEAMHYLQDLHHCAQAWRFALLLYIERVFKWQRDEPVPPHLGFLARKTLNNVTSCRPTDMVQKQLLLPVFLAGCETEDDNLREEARKYCSWWGEKTRYNMFLTTLGLLEEIWANKEPGSWWGSLMDTKCGVSAPRQYLFG